MRRSTLLAPSLLVLTFAGCGSSSSPSSSAASSSSPAPATSTTGGATGSSTRVATKNLAFTPKVLHAKVGQTVVWTNDDVPPHNVTYVSGPKFTSSGTLNPGATFKLKLTKAGTIRYFCSIHPFMKATIVVSP